MMAMCRDSSFTKLSRSTQHNIHIAAIDINGDISSSIFTFLEKSTGQADDSKEGLKVIRGKQEASNNSSYQTLNLPVGARVRIGKGRANHTANKAAAFSPDGQYLAVASSIGIWLYDTVNYQEVALLSSQYPIANIVFSPDGSIVVGTSRHGRIQNHVWSIITKEKIATFRDPIGGSVGAIAFSTNGKTIASASANRLILWDVETAQELIRIKCQNFINTLSFSHDGDMIASGESDGLIRLWDALTGQLIGAFRHDPYVSSIAFSPTEYILASCSTREGTIKLWNVATETETLTIKNKRGTSVVAFSPDGKTLAWCDIFDTINLWNVATQSLVAVYDDLTNLNINSIALSPNGKTFVSVDGHYDIVKVWDMITGNTIDLGHVGLTPISFSFDNSMLVSGGRRGVKLWNVNTGENVAIIPVKHKSRVRLVLFSPENITLAYRVSGEKFTRLWDVNKKTQIGVIQNPSIECWTFSPDGKTLASGAGRLITLWDVETKQENFTLEGHLDRIEHLTFSPDGSTLASKSGIMHSAIKLWDIKTKQNTDSFETDDPFKVFSRPVFSPDNTMLVFSRSNDGIKVWNLVTREMTDINSEDDFLTFLPNSSMMILKSYTHEYGEKVSVWNAKTATHITTLDPVIFEYWKQLIFSPDGETLAIAGQDSVTLFDPKVIYNQLPAAAPASINIVNAKQTELLSNYPNPFNPETWIPYRLAEDANVTLTIYDIEGREIKAIHIGHRKAGHYVSRNKAIYWDGTNDLGESVASGLYFYQLQADDYSETKRMLVLK